MPIRDLQAEWDANNAAWEAETHADKTPDRDYEYSEWSGPRPEAKDYMPWWPEEEKTHWQMYEDTSEGTPISPVMETPEELAHWLADNKASTFGTTSFAGYEQWLAMINQGWAPSAIVTRHEDGTGTILSGVEAASERARIPACGSDG
jgi:hypothetical protein